MQKRERQDTLPFKTIRGSLAKGKDKMAHASRKVDNHSKIALSTLSPEDIRHSSKDLNLMGSDFL